MFAVQFFSAAKYGVHNVDRQLMHKTFFVQIVL